jgi:hypothetical protein
MNLLYIILLVVFPHCVPADVDPKTVRCLGKILAFYLMCSVIFQYSSTLKSNRVPVCRNVVEEIDSAIQRVDPKRTVEVGSYRLDSIGNQQQKTVSNWVQLSVRHYIFIYSLIGYFKTIPIPCELPSIDELSVIFLGPTLNVLYVHLLLFFFCFILFIYSHIKSNCDSFFINNVHLYRQSAHIPWIPVAL